MLSVPRFPVRAPVGADVKASSTVKHELWRFIPWSCPFYVSFLILWLWPGEHNKVGIFFFLNNFIDFLLTMHINLKIYFCKIWSVNRKNLQKLDFVAIFRLLAYRLSFCHIGLLPNISLDQKKTVEKNRKLNKWCIIFEYIFCGV